MMHMCATAGLPRAATQGARAGRDIAHMGVMNVSHAETLVAEWKARGYAPNSQARASSGKPHMKNYAL